MMSCLRQREIKDARQLPGTAIGNGIFEQLPDFILADLQGCSTKRSILKVAYIYCGDNCATNL